VYSEVIFKFHEDLTIVDITSLRTMWFNSNKYV